MDILDKIVLTKKEELAEYSGEYIELLKKKISRRKYPVLDFRSAFKKGKINIIAEVKKASPSKGVIKEDFDPVAIAKIYEKSGAAAISVLTDKRYFQGDIRYIEMIREAGISIPVLRKDFIIDRKQIDEAYAFGSDTFLLIAKILEAKDLKELIEYGRSYGMEPLVEVHTKDECRKAVSSGAKIVGINNRNLKTFKVDINISKELAPYLKSLGVETVIAESGISSYEEIRELLEYGVDGFLIGESLMRADNIESKLKELMGYST
ncbi:indole-3-glycerol phosphate synthase TrpC [Persephonella sp.]